MSLILFPLRILTIPCIKENTIDIPVDEYLLVVSDKRYFNGIDAYSNVIIYFLNFYKEKYLSSDIG